MIKIRNLDVANIVITTKCNSKCISCNYWNLEKEFLDFEKINKFIPYINQYNTRKIYVTGGEPTLHPQFVEISRILRKETKSKITLCTNGVNIPKYVDKINDFYDAYIISFDSSTAKGYYSIRQVDWFDKIIKVPNLIKKKNPNAFVAFTCVIQKKNIEELDKVLILASENNVDFMGFTLPSLVNGGFGWDKEVDDKIKKEIIPDKNQIKSFRSMLRKLKEIEDKINKNKENGTKIIQSYQGLHNYVDQLKFLAGEKKIPVKKNCPVPLQEIVLDANGEIRPCYILNSTHKFNFDVDPVNDKAIMKLRGNIYRKFIYPESCNYCYIRLIFADASF